MDTVIGDGECEERTRREALGGSGKGGSGGTRTPPSGLYVNQKRASNTQQKERGFSSGSICES